MSSNNIPNGHERSYRRGKADAMKLDRRSSAPKVERPEDLPEGHGKSYDKGFKDGLTQSK